MEKQNWESFVIGNAGEMTKYTRSLLLSCFSALRVPGLGLALPHLASAAARLISVCTMIMHFGLCISLFP